MYSNLFDKQDEPVGGTDKQSDSEASKLTMTRSLSTIFSHQLSQISRDSASFEPTSPTARGPSLPYSRSASMGATARRRTQQENKCNYQSSDFSTSCSFKSATKERNSYSITFSNINYAKFTSTFLGATSEEEGRIELFLEEESAFSKPCLMAELDKQRRGLHQNGVFGNDAHTIFNLGACCSYTAP